jgi:renalase
LPAELSGCYDKVIVANRKGLGMDTDVIVIGAGLSGLIAAQQIEAANKKVIVLDKGKSVGGRLATQSIQNGLADYGAQFFTVRTAEFQKRVDEWLEEDVVSIWGYGWSDGSLKRTAGDGHPRYIANKGMNALAKSLALQLKAVQTSITVNSVHWLGDSWRVTDNNNMSLTSRALVLTPPVPQSTELLVAVPLEESDKQALDRIQYGPCLAGIFVVDGEVYLPEPGAVQDFSRSVYWIADNRAKGISPNEVIITLHAEDRYSRQHYDAADSEIVAMMSETLQQYMGAGASIKEAQIKRWRYSIPLTSHPQDILKTEGFPLIFAGDAFGGRGRVEGAYLSGLAAGKAAIELI